MSHVSRFSIVGMLALAACAPKVHMDTSPYDMERSGNTAEPAPAVATPAHTGQRSGTIARATLVKTLDAGPGQFLQQFEVAGALDGERFVGWQFVRFTDDNSPLHDLDLAPGDILVNVNGQPLARPDQLQALWDSLRTAPAIDAELRRGDATVQLHFTIAD